MNSAPSFSIFLLPILAIVLGLVLFGLIMLFRWASRRGDVAVIFAVICTIGTLLMLLTVPLLFVANARQASVSGAPGSQAYVYTQESSATSRYVPLTTSTSTPTASLDTNWHPAAEILPDAAVDFYPSKHEAEQAIAAAIVKAYGTQGRTRSGFNQPQPLALVHAMDGPGTEEYQGVADAVRNLGAPCHAVKPGISNHTHQYGIRLELSLPDETNHIGIYLARDDHLDVPVPFAFTARFVDKPWLTDLAAYRIVEESPSLVVGFTGLPESTEAEAEAVALRMVAARLAPRVVDHRGNGNYDSGILYPELDSLASNLKHFSLIKDQFTQQFERSYGTVFRHAVLIDLTPETIERLYNGNNLVWTDMPPEQQLAQGTSHGDATAFLSTPAQAAARAAETAYPASALHGRTYAIFVARVLGLGVLIGLTLLIYRVLDRWTLGYRQGALTMASIVVILGGATLIGLLFVG